MMLILAVTFMGQLLYAQETTSTELNKSKSETSAHQKKGKHKKGEMLQQLNLTDEQRTKLKGMKADHKQKRDAIKNDNSLNEEQKKEKMHALKEEQKKNMQSTLTDEQKQQMKEMKVKSKKGKKGQGKKKAGAEITQ